MKKILYMMLALSMALFLAAACQKDENQFTTDYVNDIVLHLTYEELGNSLSYTHPPVVKMVNQTEQLEQHFQADAQGHVTLSGLLPGHYSMSVNAALTAEEMSAVTGNPDALPGPLSGAMSNLFLTLGQDYDFKELKLFVPQNNPVIFKELYYAGSRLPSEGPYRNDSFYSIYNNSVKEVDLSDYYIVSTENFGGFEPGPLWPGEEIGNYKHVYAATVWKIISGQTGEAASLKAGEEAVIAVMAAPHNKNPEFNLNSPVDLSDARFEAYCPDPENNYADFAADNMELTFWPCYGYLWRISVFGQGMALVKATREEMESFKEVTLPESFQDPFEDDQYWICKQIPIEYVEDAVDLIQNPTTLYSKRFPPQLDAGGATVKDTYIGASVIRKVAMMNGDMTIYQDTNNSTEDFIINPTPLK